MKTQESLFDLGSSSEPSSSPSPRVDALVQRAQRHQVETGFTLDDRVAHDHAVRAIEAVIGALDLTGLDARIRANEEVGGRPAIDPRIALTLRVFGTTQGEAHASEIARRTRTDDIYRWICVDGGYVQKEEIRRVERGGTRVFAPQPKRIAAPGGARDGQRTGEEQAFHKRIASEEGKAIYAKRGEVAELTSAHAKTRHGLEVIVLRGLKGARTMALLAALAKDIQVLVRERAERAQWAEAVTLSAT